MSLTGKSPADTYKDLLYVDNNNSGADATTRIVKTGNGSATGLLLSTRHMSFKPDADTTTTLTVTDADNNIKLPKIYSMGFPNANCIGCVKATSPTYWNLVRSKFPEVFNERAKQSRLIGSKLVRYKNERIMLDELPKNAKGRSLKNYDFECGIFCEEKL